MIPYGVLDKYIHNLELKCLKFTATNSLLHKLGDSLYALVKSYILTKTYSIRISDGKYSTILLFLELLFIQWHCSSFIYFNWKIALF